MSHPREVVRFLIKDIVTFHNEPSASHDKWRS